MKLTARLKPWMALVLTDRPGQDFPRRSMYAEPVRYAALLCAIFLIGDFGLSQVHVAGPTEDECGPSFPDYPELIEPLRPCAAEPGAAITFRISLRTRPKAGKHEADIQRIDGCVAI